MNAVLGNQTVFNAVIHVDVKILRDSHERAFQVL